MNKTITIQSYTALGWRDRGIVRQQLAETHAVARCIDAAAALPVPPMRLGVDRILAPYGLRVIDCGYKLHILDERLNRRRVSGSVWDGRKLIWRAPRVVDDIGPVGKLRDRPKIRCAHRSWRSAQQQINCRRDLPSQKPRDTDDPRAAEAFLLVRGRFASPAARRSTTMLMESINDATVKVRDSFPDAPPVPWKPGVHAWAVGEDIDLWRKPRRPCFLGPLNEHPAWRWIEDEAHVFAVNDTWERLVAAKVLEASKKPLVRPVIPPYDIYGAALRASAAVDLDPVIIFFEELRPFLRWLIWHHKQQMQVPFPVFAFTGPCRMLAPSAHVDPGRPGGSCCRWTAGGFKTCLLQCWRRVRKRAGEQM